MAFDATTIREFTDRYGMTITSFQRDTHTVDVYGGVYGGVGGAIAGRGGSVTINTTPESLEMLVMDAAKLKTEQDDLLLREKYPAVKDAYEKYQSLLALTRDAK